MKVTITDMKITDDNGDDWRISTEDPDGDTLPEGYWITDPDDDHCWLTLPVLKALVRAAEAAATGVLLD